jgi:hypothetical protein
VNTRVVVPASAGLDGPPTPAARVIVHAGLEPAGSHPHLRVVVKAEAQITVRRVSMRMASDDARKLAVAMDDADYVLIDGVVFETEYLRVPDENTVADDVILEAKHGDTEVAFTRAEIDDALHLGDGVYRLKSGSLLRFLTGATIH